MVKKVVIVLIVIMLVFSLYSCKEASADPNDPKAYYSEDSRYQAYLEHYNQAVENGLPGFVKYEAVSIVGEFVSFENYIGSVSSEYLYISYTCMDATGQKVYLHIRHTGAQEMPPSEKIFPGMQSVDMSAVDPASGMKRLSQEGQGGFVDVEGVRYIYTHGELYGVKWVHAGYEFMITNITHYSAVQASVFAARLLDVAQCSSAVSDFKSTFDTAMGG